MKTCTEFSWEIATSIFGMILKVKKKIPLNVGALLLK